MNDFLKEINDMLKKLNVDEETIVELDEYVKIINSDIDNLSKKIKKNKNHKEYIDKFLKEG